MKILGIDPGYDRVGIAIIEKLRTQKEIVLYSDCFKTSTHDTFFMRLEQVGKGVENVIKKYKPDILAIESLFITKNQKTAMHVSEARGVIIYEAIKNGLKVFEYSPPQIKTAVTGYGSSDKDHVMKMIPLLVKMSSKKAQDDEYDAIAVALTCLASEHKGYPQK